MPISRSGACPLRQGRAGTISATTSTNGSIHMAEHITEAASGDGGRDDTLHQILVARGWRSDRAVLPEEGDRFEWPPSIPASPTSAAPVAVADEPGRFGTTIHVDIAGYQIYGPQADDSPVEPRACYITRTALLRDLRGIEDWRYTITRAR